MDQMIFDYLEESLGISPPRAYYAFVNEWNAWRRGFYRPFHEFSETGVSGYPIKRELYRLNMAKKICEDWAALLLGEKTVVRAADEATMRWLCGEDGEHGFIGSSGLLKESASLVEKAFALGTGAAILRVEGVSCVGGRLTRTKGARLSVDYATAEQIVPISFDGRRVTEAAFISERRVSGRDVVYLETHTLGEDGYVIRNRWLERRDGKLVDSRLKEGIAPEIHTGTFVPFFAMLTPNLSNHIDEMSGLGVSVYAQAIDCLKGVDLAFNNFCRDLKLGGKKVFVNRSLVMRDENGALYTPDDVAQQLFVTIGDGDIDGEAMISEHNPELRTTENAEAVQHQLDYLSFRCGLGTRRYLFSGVQGKAQLTATQYTGELQDLIQSTAHHRHKVEEFIRGIVRAALFAAVEYLGVELDAESELSVRFDDSYFIDSESERTRDRAEVAAGLMKPYEYRMKWRGESEERARGMVGE